MNCLQFPLGSFLKYIFPEANPATSIKTVGSTIQKRKILPVKLCFINVYTLQ